MFTTTGEDRCEAEVPLSSTVVPYLTSRYIVRVQYAADSARFHEWRLLDDTTRVRRKGGTVVATAYDLVNDLAAVGFIRTVDATTGLPTFTASVEATATELIDNYILPRLAAKGYTWIARGTVDYTEKRLWEWDRLNPLELLRLICSARGYEYRLRRNGTTNYLIDVVETINGGEPQREVRPGINLLDFTRARKGAGHYTVLEGFGATQPDGRRATIARALWKVTAVNAGTRRLTLADPSGAGAGPLVEDNQYVYSGPAPGYVFRYNRGSIHRIVASFAATQEVELDDVTSYKTGDLAELRSTAGATSLASEITDGSLSKRVTAIDAGNKRLTVDDPFAGADPVGLDDRYRGWIARAYYRSASTQLNNNVAAPNPDYRQCTVTSTTGMLAGDLCYHTSVDPASAPPWTLQTYAAYEIVSVDSATLVTIKYRRKTGAVPSLTNSVYLSTWRARTPDRVCTACAAAANTLDLDSVTSVATGDLVELLRRYDGAVQTELASPSGVATHGIRAGSVDRETRGETNLLAPYNALFRNFTLGANSPADSWFHGSGGRAFGVKNTNPAYLKLGANSVRIMPVTICKFNGGISAGATSALLFGSTGSPFEVGEAVILSYGLGNAETVVLTSVSSNGTTVTIGFAPSANAHAGNEEVRSAELAQDTARPSPTVGTYGTLMSELLDCPTIPGTLEMYGVHVILYLKGLTSGDQVPVKFSITANGELGGTAVQSTLTLNPATGAVSDSFNEVWIPLTQPVPGGLMRLEIGFTPASNPYPSDKAVYVCAAGIFQTSYDPGAGNIPEYSYATELHQAVNAKLALTALGAPASYDLSVVDCFGLDPDTWPYLQLIAGVTARVSEPSAGVAGQLLRVLRLSVDFDNLAEARLEVGSRQQRFTEILANASVRVPIVRILPDGTTQVLTGVSEQPLTLPPAGPVPPPPAPLFTVRTA